MDALSKSGNQSFQNYLKTHEHVVKVKATNNYYPVDVVAEAFTEGFNAGEKFGKEELIERLVRSQFEELTQKANQVYILTSLVIKHIRENGFDVKSFHMDIFHENPKVIIAVENNLLLNDNFVDTSYQKIFEVKRVFDDLFHKDLDMGIIGSNDMDIALLRNDGYQYSEEFE